MHLPNSYAIILAGGKGERFWPLSRLHTPKHFLPILNQKPLLQLTYERLAPIFPPSHIFVVSNPSHAQRILSILPIPPSQLILEPEGKDTMAAITLAAATIHALNPSATLSILPADHFIRDIPSFHQHILLSLQQANSSPLLFTLGIKPHYPATGYGYIQLASPLSPNSPFHHVSKFVEKPDHTTAQNYLISGNYLWNAGMFSWSLPTFINSLQAVSPTFHNAFSQFSLTLQSHPSDPLPLLSPIYSSLPKISIDYALLEKSPNVAVLPAHFEWDDLGEWLALSRHCPHDQNANVTQGNAVFHESDGNIVVNHNNHLTAIIGVQDLVVVSTQDATLVCHKNKIQDIKKALASISQNPSLSHFL